MLFPLMQEHRPCETGTIVREMDNIHAHDFFVPRLLFGQVPYSVRTVEYFFLFSRWCVDKDYISLSIGELLGLAMLHVCI